MTFGADRVSEFVARNQSGPTASGELITEMNARQAADRGENET